MGNLLYIILVGVIIVVITQLNMTQKRGYKVAEGMDIQVEIMPVSFDELSAAPDGEPSARIRERVVAARAIQSARFKDEPGVHCNAQMSSRLLQRYCALSAESMGILRRAMDSYDMSARAYDRILKVARTIADLDNATLPVDKAVSAPILPAHISEAVSYRNLDRASWGSAGSSLPFQ